MSNLGIWNKFADIDPSYTKPITGKAYKGTSPNPQYVIRCLTEIFGPVGHGFGWDVVAEGFLPLGEEVLHWCRVRFWTEKRENSFEAYGQTKALMKTRNGLMLDEDAPKKSLTDAVIKAASQLGIAANIFLGRWDDQKYVQSVADQFQQTEQEAVEKASKSKARPIYESLVADMRKCQSKDDIRRWIADADVKDLRAQLPSDWDEQLRREAAEWGNSLDSQNNSSGAANDGYGRELMAG